MPLILLVVLFSAYGAGIHCAGLISGIIKMDKSLVEATIDILESCYEDRIGTVGLAGPSIGPIVKGISSRNTVIPITLIDDTSRLPSHDPVDGASRYKLQVFVIAVTDPSILAKTLIQIKNSKWWNHMASFILIDLPETRNGCSNAYEILWRTWKMNLLNSKFLCLDRTRGRLIYTFNPYTSKAPLPWRQENTYKGINGHIWTLFVRQYQEVESRCSALDFDKTIDLGGYVIRGSLVHDVATGKSGNLEEKSSMHSHVQSMLSQLLRSSLNATWTLLIHPLSEGPPVDKNGIPRGFAAEIINGSSDIALNTTFRHVWTKFDHTCSIHHSALAVVTQYPGNKSQLTKIISVLDKSSRICVFVVLLITVLFFKCYVRQPLILAILDLILVICSAPLLKMPKKLAPRIYLASVFILIITLHGIYQGKFASLLTKEERLRATDSIDDLAESDHTIYGLSYWHSFFNQSAFDKRYVQISDYNCTSYVLRDSKAACAYERLMIISEAEKFKLHLSREPMGTLYEIYLVRPDWPLQNRVNVIYERAFAGDILKPLYTRDINNLIRKLDFQEKQDRDQICKPLTLDNLSFAFVILAIGLICATVSFVIETSVHNTLKSNVRNSVRRRMA